MLRAERLLFNLTSVNGFASLRHFLGPGRITEAEAMPQRIACGRVLTGESV